MFVLSKKLKKSFTIFCLTGVSLSFMNIMAMDTIDIGKVGISNKAFYNGLNNNSNLNKISNLRRHYFAKDIGVVGTPDKAFYDGLNNNSNLSEISNLSGHYFTTDTLAEQLIQFGIPKDEVNKIKNNFWQYKLLQETVHIVAMWCGNYGDSHVWSIIPPNPYTNPNYYKPGILNSEKLINVVQEKIDCEETFMSYFQELKLKDIDKFVFSEATLFAELSSNFRIPAKYLHPLIGKCSDNGILEYLDN